MPKTDESLNQGTKKLLLYLPKKTWISLKNLSTNTEISMNELIREGIAYILKKYNKKIPKNT